MLEDNHYPPDSATPTISVVLPALSVSSILTTVERLRAQSVRGRIELILVCSSLSELELDQLDVRGFARTRIVELGPFERLAEAQAAGVRAASAPYVVLAEQHSYPEPTWAEALLAAHARGYIAVGPAMGSANPDSLVGWADLLIAFGRWVDLEGAREMDALPSHNTSYERSVLMTFDERLDQLLDTERLLFYELTGAGQRLCLEPAARTNHLNIDRVRSWLRTRYAGGRVFAAGRARPWSRMRCAVYVGGGPLIPIVRLWRMRPDLQRVSRQHAILPAVLPL